MVSTAIDRHKLMLGAEYQRDLRQRQRNYDEQPYALYLDDRRAGDRAGIYLQDEMLLHDRLRLNAGLRWAALEVLELNASTSLRDYGDEAWVYGVGAVYSATPQLGLVANWERWEFDGDSGIDPEMDLFSVGARWTFR